ncbi:tandem-95 repeat protein [Crateriforma conspicua]|uniref:Dockerin type I repeat protein n=1 Tax=Crateriforma conspicua TaxID=2527996 RepID=A0A5C5Y7J6_9PLAN|nr:tandem-95 repeat protein [Crateriforma conspicua]TWT69332.1 hypothetical protein Pan14r_16170 [Crateriforma conspicua]
MTVRRNVKKSAFRRPSRRLAHQTLEKRQLLAADLGEAAPRLVAVAANSGENFELDDNNVLSVAPSELTFRFDGGQELDSSTLSAIRFIPSGGDGSFDAEDTPITPGYVGFADDGGSRIVVARFAETLPDDIYKVEIAGFDDTNAGIVGLRNTDGVLFQPNDPLDTLRPMEEIRFEVEVGPRVTAVVPQPIEGVGASRVQHRDQIHVYFNEDPLSNPAGGPVNSATSGLPVVNPQFYKLIFTSDTVENTDDSVTLPTSVEYDPLLNRAVLTFSDDLSELTDAAGNNGSATYRLRIGSGEPLPAAPTAVDGSSDAGDLFSGATSLGVNFGTGTGSVVVSDAAIIQANDIMPSWPAAGDTVGSRDTRRDPEIVGRIDTNTGIDVYEYNFADLYGLNPQGQQRNNAITEAQKQRIREVLDLYSQRMGVQFIETEDSGLQIVTGDLRAIIINAETGSGPDTSYSLFRVNEADPSRGVLVFDGAESWFDDYGLSPDARPSFFVEAVRGVGNLLGIGHLFHLPEGVGAGGSSPDEVRSTTFSDFYPNLPVEPEFLSQSDVSLGQALHRPESNDVDFYSFSANVDGEVRIETFAQRLDGSSLLDTHLQLYRVDPATGAYELVAQNGDFFSNDSYIALDVEAGDYIVGVSAAGNENYNGEVANSGLGGLSEGRYELRVTFQGQGGTTITDTTGTELDGDADGVAGGDFNFWFQTARDTASPAADEARVIYVDKLGRDTNNGTLGAPLQTISAAFDAARPGDIVRLLPNGGADNLIQTVDDNVTYEIGRGGTNNSVLRDGSEFEVPQGVTVMIDAGAILKLQSAKISVGSESVDEDRSLASLQILGTPLPTDDDGQPLLDAAGSVFFTSYNDESIGVDTNPLPTSPQPGNWAGIEFRNDFDYSEGRPVWENEGIFLDYASHADMKYGGGSVSASRPVVNTFTMLESRPTLIYNTIQFAADAAMSADPDSFLETNFHGPIFQRVDRFTSDYDRVGPELSGNLLLDNTFNGLNIRIDTPAGGQTEPMTVSGRLDDTDIVHLLSQSLLIQGQPGGPQLLENRPDVLNVTLTQTTGGTLVDGTAYDYRVTYVTADGTESLASLPTVLAVADAGGSIEIRNLPTAPSSFAGRRLYRLNPGTMEYEFVAALDRGTTSFLDTGETRGGVLPGNGMNDTTLLPRFDARLAIDPGIVVKMLGARIEATFGADFIAEGVDGREVIFTSRADDTYGAGGTFDSNNDGSMLTPQPGDWSGLVFRQDASASLDYAQVAYGGGLSLVAGDVVDFNPIEILQADVRIAHSTIRDNADGFTSNSTRNGRGFNDESTIFVRGSQPIIVSNTIIDNEGAAISINPDALDYTDRLDHGRSTGPVDIVDSDHDNQGPLIDGNRLADNGLNGLLVRSEILTTESVWDDTDIVHIVNGEIISMTHHIRSGLRLKSDADQSLVVKFGPNGTLVGSGRPLDITDRVGGTLQVLGQGGFPVIMTSLADDTVGAGFTPAGIAQTDTDNAAATPAPGDWIGLQLESYVNDRNVAFITESERAIDAAINDNAAANDAQVVGLLARDEKSGDETARLGFNIRGALANPDDQDVYRFDAAGGTEVFIDIDDTTFGLDTVVELIDVNNRVLASSDNSFEEISDPSQLFSILPESAVEPLYRSGIGQTESPNILDAGFRVVLDGSASTTNSYYVRVRTADGKSSGQYQLSIRLREADEIAGSTIQLADIRYATDAITVSGAPLHSPLAGDASESLVYTGGGRGYDANATVLNWSPAIADQLGNLMTSDRGSLVVNGEIGNSQNVTAAARVNDLDVYQVDLFNQQLEPDVFNSEQRYVQATFDIDYADGLGRVNTSLAVYDSTGRLILHSRDSNVADDQGQPTAGVDTENLTAGSAGTADAYIGPVELPEGTYYVVVSNASAVPEALGQFFDPDSAHTNVRLQPINSLRRIADDNLDGTLGWTADEPVVPLFNTGGVGDSPIVEYSLEDVRLFVGLESNIGGGQEDSTLVSFNPFTGTLDRLIGDWDQAHGDIAMRRDGTLYTYTTDPPEGSNYQSGNIGNYLRISTTDASETNIGDDSLTFYRTNQGGNGVEVDNGQNSDDSTFIVEAMAFRANDNGLGNGSINNTAAINQNDRFVAIGNRRIARDPTIPVGATENILYLMQTTTGQATRRGSLNGQDIQYGQAPYNIRYGAAENRPEMGIVDTGNYLGNNGDGGIITGVDYLPDGPSTEMVAVTDNGGVHVFDYTVNQPALFGDLVGYNEVIPTEYYGQLEPHPEHGVTTLTFSGLEFGPRGVANGALRNVLFATTADGWLYAFELDAVTQSLVPSYVFYNGRSAVPLVTATGIASPTTTGLAFSTLEAAPWHTTTDRRNDGGHGFSDVPYDNSRLQVNNAGNSFYYGFEIDNSQPNNTLERPEGDALGQLAPGGSHGTIISNAFSLEGYSSNDKPTVYFNYFLEVEADDDYVPNTRNQNDALRVFASGDDGVWHLLATNDNYRSASGVDEYDYFATSGIPVQEIFDDSGTWRQARIDISPLAGNENVRLRFDFSTDGTMRAHAGSVELVAVPGDEIPDNSTVVATTQTGIGTETVVLENIVGQDIVVPDGSQLTDGDQFIVQSPTGNVTATFRQGPLATDPLPGEIVFLPTSTADEVAQAVVAGLPKLLRPYNDGGGRVSLLAATNVIPLGNTPIGLNTTVKLDNTFDSIVAASGERLASGESIDVSIGGNTTTITFVTAAESTGVTGEIIFDGTETADEIAAAIYAELSFETGAYLDAERVIFTQPVTIAVNPSTTKIVVVDPLTVSEGRMTVQIPADPAADINNDEFLRITGPSGTEYVIDFQDDDFPFNQPGVVYKQNGNELLVAERLFNAINGLDVTGELGAILDGDTVSVFATTITQDEDSQFTYATVTDTESRLQIQIPDAVDLRSGEQLLVSDGTDSVVLTFVEQGQIPPTAFNLVYFDDSQTGADLFDSVIQLLRGADINAYQSPDGLGVNVVVDPDPDLGLTDPPVAFITTDPVYTSLDTDDVDTSVVPITVPGGDRLVDGETITLVAKNDPTAANAQTITFVLDDGMTMAGPNEVLFLPTDTGADIAEALWEVIDPQFQAVQSTGNVLYLIYGRSASVQAGSAIVSFSPSVPGAIAVQLDSTMNSFAVADQLRISIAEGFGAVTADDGISKATIDQYALVGGNRIRIFQTSFSSVGPYGLSTALPGDEFGETVSTSFTATNQIRSQGAANNEVEGVYIDDIIIGFAERGEMVLDAPTNVFDFINNPETTRGSTQPERPNEILVGEYSLEIRASDEFGVPTDAAVGLGLTSPAGTGRSFDTNDRLTEGAVTLFTQAGQYLQDGDTFVLYDGTNSLTFEFDDVLQPGIADGNVRVVFDASEDEPQYVAVAIRNAINTPQVQEVLDIVAATYDSDDSNNVPGESITTGNRVELFGEDIQVNPGGGRFIRMDLVAEETYQGRATSRTMPMVDHDTQTVTYVNVGDSLARSAVSGYVNGDTDVLVATGKIGDRVDEAINGTAFGGLPTSDTDSVRIYLSMNQVIDIDLDTFGYTKDNSFFLAELSVFDGDETLLASANSGFAPGESQQGVFLTFTAPADGYYDIQVATIDVVGGEYALTVRPHAATNDLIPDRDVLIVDYQTGQTDENRERDQGQILISGNFISHSANYGISATAGDRGQAQVAGGAADDLARPGSAALRRNVNPESQIPGAVLTNNVVYDSGVGGILFAGGTQNAGQSPAPVSYGRIVNNTVVGNGSGSGITVESSAAPTLLNNVVTNFATGIDVDASSEAAGTVIGANAFQDNGTNATVPLSAQSIVIPSGTPVFADPAREIYIPAMGSQIIDSSVAELADRSDLFLTVKEPSGISPSPIIAPGFDAYGQPRIDDPTVSSPGGVGGNVFIDRGAIDRSDSTRPIAVLTTPQDAIGSIVPDGDGDPDESFVRLAMGTVEFFELQLLDENGTGPDGATITEESVLLTENGRRLIPGVDFTFGYSDNSRTIRLTPLAGLWNPDAVYEITLNNSERVAYDAPAGNEITDGDQLVITDASGNESVFEFESGYVLNIPTPKSVSVGAPSDFQDGAFFTITAPDGTSQRFEFNKAGAVQTGNVEIDISTAGTVVGVRDAILAALSDPAIITMLDIAPVAVGQSDIQLGFTSNHAISGTVAGLTIFGSDQAVEDGDIFSYTGNGNTVNFELTFDDDPVAGTNVAVRLERTDTPDEMAAKIAAVVAAQPLGLDGAQAIGDGSILLGGTAQDSLSIGNIAIQTIGMAGVTGSLMITVPSGTTGSAVNGQTFTVTNGTLSETFQLNTDPNATSANRLVTFDAAATANEIAAVIASEIGIAFTGTLSPTANGNVIALGEQPAIPPAGQSQVSASVDVGTSTLVVDGVSGGAIPVRFLPTADFSPLAVAATLVEAVRLSPLDSETFSPGGGTILFSQTESIIGIGADGQPVDVASIVPAVSDLAGNPVAPNRDNQETRFTIIMPEVKFDFGDAPQSGGLSYPTMLDVNGARHALTNTTSVILGSLIDSEPDGQPSPGADDDRLPMAVTQSDSLFTIADLGDGTTELELVQAPAGRETLTVNIDGTVFTLEFIRVVDNPTGNNLPVVFADGESLSSIATKTFTVIRGQLDSFGGSVVGDIGDPDDAIFRLTAIDDEDGVSTGTFTALNGDVLTVFATPGSSGTLTADEVVGFLNKADSAGTPIAITVTGTGLLDGWIDFNADGDFNDDGEQIFRSEPVTTGVNSLTVQVPMTAIEGETWMRLRVSDSGNLGPDGVSVGGEVEDYEVSVRSIAPATPVDDSYLGMLDEDNTLEITDQASGLLINDTNLDTQLLPVGAFIVDQPANGVVEMIDPFAGTFRYTPNQDFNGTDTFTYRLGTQEMVGDAVLAASPTATVTIDVQPVNDDPVFDAQTMLELLERDVADDTITIPGVITNAAAGPPTAEDELANQTLTLSIVGVTETPGLMQTATQITQDGDLIVDPAPNAYGTAEYVIQISDGIVDLTTTVTVVVQPVNDPPQIDPSVAGQSDMAGPDDQYSVSAVDGSITYTLSEDNSADPNSDSFFIPLQQDGSAAGYARIGLMDVFVAGPPNELANLPGGNQILELDRIDLTTARGGTLTPVADGGQIIGFNYVPPVDLNSDVVQFDQFTYDVIDDNPNGGETYSLDQGMLVEDRLTASNTVLLVLNPVNDAPQFNLPQGLVQVEEDSTRRVFNNFATGIAAASPVTAFDEIDAISGQNVFFELTPQDFNPADMADFFSEAPMISAGGDLVFRPAADVFGSFEFDVVLFDDGANDPSRGDINQSAAMTLTIEILPINDPPMLVDPNQPLAYTVDEDGSIEIPVGGDGITTGMLDQFFVGPANEAADIAPEVGGNQTLALARPYPIATAAGGTLTPVLDSSNEIVALRYTPRENFTGADSFIYTVTDDGQTAVAGGPVVDDPRIAAGNVLLTVNPINDPPQFSLGDDVVVDEDAGTVTVSDWATNVQAGPTSASDEVNGTATVDPQVVSFMITQVSTTNENLFDGSVTATVNGTNGELVFTPADDQSGTATFEVKLMDDGGTDNGGIDTSEVRTFTITVNPINDPPTYTPGTDVTVNEDSGAYNEPWATDISPGPADESSQTVSFVVETPTQSQSLFASLPQISPDGTLQFTPADDAAGVVDLTVRAIDSDGAEAASTTLTITITPVNDVPIAVADELEHNEDSILTIPSSVLLANDIDVDPTDTLTVVLPASSFTSNGARLTYNSTTGDITYDPTDASLLQQLAEGQTLFDTFTYQVIDSAGATSQPVTVTIDVEGRNDAPVLVPDNPSLNQDGPTVITPLVNDFDIDGAIDPSSIEITSQPSFGSLEVRPNGTIIYTPFAGTSGTDSFTYTVADESGLRSQPATITLGLNVPPIANNDRAVTYWNETINIDLVDNDVDNDGLIDPESLSIVTSPAFGQVSVNTDGTVDYIPADGFVGNDSFQYTVSDEAGFVSNTALVSVQVIASRLQNQTEFNDVNDDGFITAIDALLIINELERAGGGPIAVEPDDVPPPYYDVSGDRFITAFDSLLVINHLNRTGGGSVAGEGESSASVAPLRVDSAQSVTAPVGDVVAATTETVTDRVVGSAQYDVVEDSVLGLIAVASDDDDEDSVDAIDAALTDLL